MDKKFWFWVATGGGSVVILTFVILFAVSASIVISALFSQPHAALPLASSLGDDVQMYAAVSGDGNSFVLIDPTTGMATLICGAPLLASLADSTKEELGYPQEFYETWESLADTWRSQNAVCLPSQQDKIHAMRGSTYLMTTSKGVYAVDVETGEAYMVFPEVPSP